MQRVVLSNSISTLEYDGSLFSFLEDLKFACSYAVQGARFSNVFQKGQWDGRKSLLKFRKGNVILFPTGLLDIIEKIFKINSVEYNIIDNRKREFTNKRKFIFTGENREYQNCENLAIEKERGVIHVATRGGKNAIYARIICRLGLQTTVIVPTKDIMKQTADDISKYLNTEVGVVGDGKWKPDFITVAIINSLSRNKNELEKMKFFYNSNILIIDEYHRSASNTWAEMGLRSDAYYRFGGSGTPKRPDGKNLVLKAVTGDIFYSVTASKLIEKKIIAKPYIKMIELDFWQQKNADNYSELYSHCIVQNQRRNYLIMFLAQYHIEKNQQVMIFVDRKEHGWIFEKLIPGSRFVYGKHKSEYRNEALEDFRAKKLNCLIATTIFNEGVTLPSLKVAILASGGKSSIKVLQILGRSLGISDDGDDTSIFYDFIDLYPRTFYRHAIQRIKIYQKEKEFELERVPIEAIRDLKKQGA